MADGGRDDGAWFDALAREVERGRSGPKYRAIAAALEEEIRAGRLTHHERLPTVREFSERLRVSGTTIAAAYKLLTERGLIESRVGSGTRVTTEPGSSARSAPSPQRTRAWRRRTQTTHIGRLRAASPEAVNYASGTPDPALLPLEVLRRAWLAAAGDLTREDLRYAGPAPVEALARRLGPRLEADLVPARPADMVIGSSAQQLMTLAVRVVAEMRGRPQLRVAVEEPGYPTIFDTFERLGHRLVGVRVDEAGAVPASLEEALAGGADMVLFTPRAHNPTGASWTEARRDALADVLAAHPEVVAVEDDQFADAIDVRSGSLLSDERLEDRVVYIRSFSKAIAPDLRLALAVARPRLRALLTEEKFYADGWSPSLAQAALAHAFADPALDEALARACRAYGERRRDLAAALLAGIDGGLAVRVAPGSGSVNVWVRLPPGQSAAEVADRAAAAGLIVATGEPFFIRVGRDDALRVNAGTAADGAGAVGRALAAVIREVSDSASAMFLHHTL